MLLVAIIEILIILGKIIAVGLVVLVALAIISLCRIAVAESEYRDD